MPEQWKWGEPSQKKGYSTHFGATEPAIEPYGLLFQRKLVVLYHSGKPTWVALDREPSQVGEIQLQRTTAIIDSFRGFASFEEVHAATRLQ